MSGRYIRDGGSHPRFSSAGEFIIRLDSSNRMFLYQILLYQFPSVHVRAVCNVQPYPSRALRLRCTALAATEVPFSVPMLSSGQGLDLIWLGLG